MSFYLRQLGITDADFDALYGEMTGIIPASGREEFPDLLAQMLEQKQATLRLSPEEIVVAIVGGFVTCTVRRPCRE